MIQCFSFSMHAFQDDVLRINYTKTIIEKGKEAPECFEQQEFDFTEFWFDDTLSVDEDLPEHLRLQLKDNCNDTHEPFHAYKDYVTVDAKGELCIKFDNLNYFFECRND